MKRARTENSIRCTSGSNILVLAPSWIGDAVMSLPFFFALREVFPEGRITVFCRSYLAGIFSRCPDIDSVIQYDRRDHLISRVLRIRRSAEDNGIGYRRCYVLPPSFSSALTAALSGAGRRIGYRTDLRSLLLTDSLSGEMYRKGHHIDGYLRLIDLASPGISYSRRTPELEPPPDWRERVEGLGLSGRYTVISPGAMYGAAKMYPAGKYRKLAEMIISDEGNGIVFAGSEKEREYIDRISGQVKGAKNLAGKTDIGGLISVLRGSESVIGNDSGTVHLSAALGIPTVALFGSTSPEWTAPRGRYVTVMNSDAECSPCFDRECERYGRARCYDDIKVEDVYKAVSELMNRSSN